jgi:rhamnosyltransferase
MTTLLWPRVAIVVPVLNGGDVWRKASASIQAQTPAPARVLVIDSGSTDDSAATAESAGFDVWHIDKQSFDHGGTRQQAIDALTDADVVVFLTQDAVADSAQSVALLVRALDDPRVGVAYGRQLPRPQAGVLEAHARRFNYPAVSSLRCFDDRGRLGIKTAFTSNSFAAYRRDALLQTGGFPRKLILGEDMVAAAGMLKEGWLVAYVADARVFHSHGYTLRQELRRYFDIGVLHIDQHWLLETFGSAEGEGVAYVRSEIREVLRRAPLLLPSAVVRIAAKYLGYRLGLASNVLPRTVCRKLSMHQRYWN